MNVACIFGLHKWEGCRCLKCGNARDAGHDWRGDCEKCAKCGTRRQGAHKWDGCTCRVCGIPNLAGELADFDLFHLLGNRPIAANVAMMFEATRRTVGGSIKLVDLYFEDGVVLRNVRIANERIVTIPSAYGMVPIKTVGVADLDRHRAWPPMTAERR